MPEPELDALLPDPAGGVCGYLHVRGEDFALRVLSGVAGGPATLDEQTLRERFRNVGLSDLSP